MSVDSRASLDSRTQPRRLTRVSLVVVAAIALSLVLGGCHYFYGFFGDVRDLPGEYRDDLDCWDNPDQRKCPVGDLWVWETPLLPSVGDFVTIEAYGFGAGRFDANWDVNDDGTFEARQTGDESYSFRFQLLRTGTTIVALHAEFSARRGTVVHRIAIEADDNDYEVPRSSGGAVGLFAAPTRLRSRGRSFTARLVGRTVTPGTLDAKGGKRGVRGGLGFGSFKARIGASRGGGAIKLRGTALSRSSMRIDRRSGDVSVRGIALVRMDRRPGFACLRYQLRRPRGERARGKMRIIAAAGSSEPVGGMARFKASRLGGFGTRFKGNVRISSRASRAQLPTACEKLNRRAAGVAD